MQAVFGPGGEHPVGLVGTFGDQVVDHDADITLGTRNDDGRTPENGPGGVNSCNQSLTGGFFVAGSTVDLSGEV